MSLHSLKSHSAERSTVVTPELMRAQQIHLPNKPSTAADLLKDSLNPIEDEIRNLRAQLPPIDMSALDEEEVPPVDESGRNRICTCCFVEVEQEKEVDQIHVNIEKTENAEEKDQIMDVEGLFSPPLLKYKVI